MPYHLFQSLRGHTSAIRAISHCGETADILSAGRDLWAKTWQYSPELGYHVVSNFAGHKDFISCATYVPPSEHYPSGLCVTGGYDKNVIVFTPDTEELVATISSLSSAVTALHVIDNTLLVVACSDGAVSLYKISYLYENVELAAIQHFSGHSLPVWAVIFTAGYIITGCADKAIRVFDKGGTLFRKLEGHTDCVRALASLHHSDQFLSGGNDGVIRRWSALKDNCLQTYQVHSNSIYSIAVSPENLFFTSCGEDSEVYVCYNAFTDGEVEIEKINHPSQSVWSIMVLRNNDIVTGSCDGQVRVFSQNPERKASGDALVFFNQEIADTEKSRKSGGQTSGGTNQTPATNGSQQSKPTNSNELVFYIDIDDSKPALPLHYRKGEDEYAVAKAFLEKHNISLVYLENIVEFIRKNAPIAMPVTAETESYVDPFTGGSRYIPEGERGDRQSENASQRSEENQSSTSNTDFSAYFPQKDYVISEVANVPKIQEKALELCISMPGNIDAEGILKVMSLVTSDGNPSEDSIESLMKMLLWPESSIFPVLDIMRLVIKKSATNKMICASFNGVKLIQQLLRFTAHNSLPVNRMLSYRIISNMLVHPDGRVLYLKHKDLIYSNLKFAVDESSTKQIQIAAATLFLNLSVLYTKKFDKNEIARCMDTVEDLLRFFKDDEAVFRIVVSLGTLMIFNSTKPLRKTSRDYLSHQLANNKIDKVLTVCGLLVARFPSNN